MRGSYQGVRGAAMGFFAWRGGRAGAKDPAVTTLPVPIDTLFLDAGNTLVGMDLDLVCETLAAHGVPAAPADVERAEARARPLLSRHLGAGRSSEARDTFAFHVANVLAGLPHGRPDARDERSLAPAVATRLKDAGTRRLWSRVLPGVPEALAALRAAGVRLAVVSNSDGTVEEGLERAGLRGHLDAVFDSARVGWEKPDPRIFAHALATLRCAPERAAHAGDLFAVDVLGARAAGVHGILVDPFADWSDEPCHVTPDVPALARELLTPTGTRREG
jgi:putative hydrolase of the HAD superfamily